MIVIIAVVEVADRINFVLLLFRWVRWRMTETHTVRCRFMLYSQQSGQDSPPCSHP